MISIHDTVPEMELDAFLGDRIDKVKLGGERDNWTVLLFYPADFTFVCPTELEEAADLQDEFKKAGAELMSVSTDTAFTHKAWHESSKAVGKVRYPMLADPAGKLCRELGTYIEDEGLSFRATFMIDPKGEMRSIEIHDNAVGRSMAEVLRKLRAFIHVAANPDAVCPASWQPGQETLKPKFDLIGRI